MISPAAMLSTASRRRLGCHPPPSSSRSRGMTTTAAARGRLGIPRWILQRVHTRCPVVLTHGVGTTAHVVTFSSYRQMRDFGGASSSTSGAASSPILNTAQNLAVQAICFDFHLIVSLPPPTLGSPLGVSRDTNDGDHDDAVGDPWRTPRALPMPPSSTIHDNPADLDRDSPVLIRRRRDSTTPVPSSSTNTSSAFISHDVRVKYAPQLRRQGLVGGVAELARTRAPPPPGRQMTPPPGDAAGHWAVRAAAVASSVGASPSSSSPGSSSTTRWMARSETGAILQSASQRALQLALLPQPQSSVADMRDEWRHMRQFQQQLRGHVTIHWCGHDRNHRRDESSSSSTSRRSEDQATENGSSYHHDPPIPFATPEEETAVAQRSAALVMQECLSALQRSGPAPLRPQQVLVVTDRDDYVRAAKDLGMVTCRLRTNPNAPRGHVSPHYTITSLADVQDILHEINGISFASTLSQAR